MTEPKWTPGPWRVGLYDAGDCSWHSGTPSIEAPEDLDCAIVHWDGFAQQYWRSARGDAEIHANAHLIAAAPELYEALAEAEEQLSLLAKRPDDNWWVQKARAAMARARGEA